MNVDDSLNASTAFGDFRASCSCAPFAGIGRAESVSQALVCTGAEIDRPPFPSTSMNVDDSLNASTASGDFRASCSCAPFAGIGRAESVSQALVCTGAESDRPPFPLRATRVNIGWNTKGNQAFPTVRGGDFEVRKRTTTA